MREDDVEAILAKTGEYYHFIKNRVDKTAVKLRQSDQETFGIIHSDLTKFTSVIRIEVKSTSAQERKNILETCITHLQILDRIAKDYKLFPTEE